jgi:hypothetical protein
MNNLVVKTKVNFESFILEKSVKEWIKSYFTQLDNEIEDNYKELMNKSYKSSTHQIKSKINLNKYEFSLVVEDFKLSVYKRNVFYDEDLEEDRNHDNIVFNESLIFIKKYTKSPCFFGYLLKTNWFINDQVKTIIK